MMPSRDFLVRQAVLNAFAVAFPVTNMANNLPGVMRFYVEDEHMPHWIRNRITDEFRTLTQRYSEAA